MKKHIEYFKIMIQSIDSSIKFYEIIPKEISKLIENNEVACIVKREDENLLSGLDIHTKYNYTINIISKDITKDILSTESNPGLIQQILKYLLLNGFDESDVIIRAGSSGISTDYIEYGIYILFINILFEEIQ
jgi:hypothetical protein